MAEMAAPLPYPGVECPWTYPYRAVQGSGLKQFKPDSQGAKAEAGGE